MSSISACRGSIRTIFNGSNSTRFRPLHDQDMDRPIIDFVGKTDPIKGPDVLLRAALKLTEVTTRFAVQIVGRKYYDRDEPDAYQDDPADGGQLEAGGVHGDVHGVGGPRASRGARPRSHPCRALPLGRGVPPDLFEGMAAGMAVIGSRTGGTPEVIGDAGLHRPRGRSRTGGGGWAVGRNRVTRAEYAGRARTALN